MFAAEIRRKRVDRMPPAHPLALARGRGLCPHQRRDALPLEGRRPRGRGAGVLRHQGTGQGGGAQVHQEGAQAPRLAQGDHHRTGCAPTAPRCASWGTARSARWAAGPTTGWRTPTSRSDDGERAMLRFRRMKTLQAFASVHASFHNHFNQERHLTSRENLQGQPLSRTGRVADPRRLASAGVGGATSRRRQVAVGLTAPAKAMLTDPTITVEEVARQMGVQPSTLYRHIPGGRSSLAAEQGS